MGSDSSKMQRSASVCNPEKSPAVNQRRMFLPAIKVGSSPSCSNENVVKDTGSFSERIQRRPSSTKSLLELNTTRRRNGSISSTASYSPRPRHPITFKNRQLVQSCFRNPHEILGKRIMKKACDRRSDFAHFFNNLDIGEKEEFEENTKVFLKKAVANIEFIDEVQRLGEEFGASHVLYRDSGFKPDFFAIIADASVTECTYLDNAVHPSHQTLDACSSFVSVIFSSVRDGFYTEMRRSRRASNALSTGSTSSRRSGKLSAGSNADFSVRSVSLGAESRLSDDGFQAPTYGDPDDGFLKPPSSPLTGGTNSLTKK